MVSFRWLVDVIQNDRQNLCDDIRYWLQMDQLWRIRIQVFWLHFVCLSGCAGILNTQNGVKLCEILIISHHRNVHELCDNPK